MKKSLRKCKKCGWIYRVPKCLYDRKLYGDYVCLNREVEEVGIDAEGEACKSWMRQGLLWHGDQGFVLAEEWITEHWRR